MRWKKSWKLSCATFRDNRNLHPIYVHFYNQSLNFIYLHQEKSFRSVLEIDTSFSWDLKTVSTQITILYFSFTEIDWQTPKIKWDNGLFSACSGWVITLSKCINCFEWSALIFHDKEGRHFVAIFFFQPGAMRHHL